MRQSAQLDPITTVVASKEQSESSIKMRILSYHGIPAARAAEFERQLRYLSSTFKIVPLAQIVQNISNRTGENEIAITFDDGLENNYTVVYPVLKKLRIPAAFFVCSGLLDGQKWAWNHEARARLSHLSSHHRRSIVSAMGAPSTNVEELIEWMKAKPFAQRLELEACIRKATPDFAPTPLQREEFDPMNWEQLCAMDPDLVTIGSHTVSHPILSRMDDALIEVEVSNSRWKLEERLNRPVEYFCYPNGAYDERVVRYVRKHYRAAVTTISSDIEPDTDPYQLPRIPAPKGAFLLLWRMRTWRRSNQCAHNAQFKVRSAVSQ